MPDRERWERERELLFALLQLAHPGSELERVRACLGMLAQVTGAARAYAELYPRELTLAAPHFSLSVGCDEEAEADIRALTSRGIVAAALAAGELVHTASAALDERFRERGSVQARGLEAVLCVPLGEGSAGVLYLEGRPRGGPFSPADVELTQRVGLCLQPLVEAIAAVAAARDRHDPTAPYRQRLELSAVVGRSAALASVFHAVSLAAPANLNVLVTGPSGTGKTQIARAIHDNGPRRHAPFVELNCAALPEGLIESELFGTMPGAFPGARRSVGKAAAADGGTLFLDEVGEIPFAAQAKLLQVLQSGQFYPLGAATPLTVNVRVIAATNQDLEALVKERRFREDLWFRLNVLTIRMPTLAERADDLPPLVAELLVRAAAELGVARLPPSPALIGACAALALPGNVRQLRSRLTVALLQAQAERATQVEPRHLREPDGASDVAAAPTFHAATRAFQRDFLARELAASGWNVADVAQRIDLTRAHVYNLIRELGIQRPEK